MPHHLRLTSIADWSGLELVEFPPSHGRLSAEEFSAVAVTFSLGTAKIVHESAQTR